MQNAVARSNNTRPKFENVTLELLLILYCKCQMKHMILRDLENAGDAVTCMRSQALFTRDPADAVVLTTIGVYAAGH